jgi:hypothetical protein
LSDRTCSIDGCERAASSRGWCKTHYGRWLAHGDPLVVKKPRIVPADERFWAKVDVRGHDQCWEWTASRNWKNYGKFSPQGTGYMGAHRYSAMLHFGMFDRRDWVLHHCDNPPCVNPSHLYVGTRADNSRDMAVRKRARNQYLGRTHCSRGHEYTEENTIVQLGRAGREWRLCRYCQREYKREWDRALSADPVKAARAKALRQQRHTADYWRAYRAKRKADGRPIRAKKLDPSDCSGDHS